MLITASQKAASKELVELILQGSSCDEVDQDGTSVLMHSCLSSKRWLSHRVIELGADIECRDRYGRTALSIAVHQGDLELVKLLVKKQATIEYEFAEIARRRGHIKVAEYFEHRLSLF